MASLVFSIKRRAQGQFEKLKLAFGRGRRGVSRQKIEVRRQRPEVGGRKTEDRIRKSEAGRDGDKKDFRKIAHIFFGDNSKAIYKN
jgi:hypothetical protein